MNKLQRDIYAYLKTGSVCEDQLMWVTDESTETIEEFVAGVRAELALARKNRQNAAGMPAEWVPPQCAPRCASCVDLFGVDMRATAPR